MFTDQQISVLVDVASSGGARVPPDRLVVLLGLIVDDYVDSAPGTLDRYKLTAKGQAALDERGVGANKS
jgi:hypothetical protein